MTRKPRSIVTADEIGFTGSHDGRRLTRRAGFVHTTVLQYNGIPGVSRPGRSQHENLVRIDGNA